MPNSNSELKYDHFEVDRKLVFGPVQIMGGWPIPYLRIRNLKDILKDTPRLVIEGNFRDLRNVKKSININDMINGGMKIPHLHIDNEIFLLEKPVLKKYLYAIADEIDNIKDFSELHHIK